jgi:hypothetical protein
VHEADELLGRENAVAVGQQFGRFVPVGLVGIEDYADRLVSADPGEDRFDLRRRRPCVLLALRQVPRPPVAAGAVMASAVSGGPFGRGSGW